MSALERLPFEPLRAYVESRVIAEPGIRDGGKVEFGWPKRCWQRKAYSRAAAQGTLTDRAADKLAVDLGIHPCELWPDWFDRVGH